MRHPHYLRVLQPHPPPDPHTCMCNHSHTGTPKPMHHALAGHNKLAAPEAHAGGEHVRVGGRGDNAHGVQARVEHLHHLPPKD